MSLTSALSARARIAVNTVGLLLVLAVLGLATNDLGLLGDSGLNGFFNDWVYNCAEVAAAGLVLARALLVRRERGAWLMLALGIGFFAAGDIYYTLVIEQLSNPPSPSLADAGYLMFYIGAYTMMVLLVRAHVRAYHASVWLDGAIGALAVAALGAALVLVPVMDTTHGSLASVATNLAYPLGDLLVVAFVIGVFALTGWRPGRTWLLIGAGFATLAVADGIFLFRVAESAYQPGTILDALWPAGLVMLSYAAWSRPRERGEVRFEGLAVMVIPCVFASIALFLIIRANYVHLDLVSESLAAAALLAAGARFALTFNDVRNLSEIRERQARTDDLTGLANRRHFYASLNDAIARCRTHDTGFALLMVDLDDFKELNDTLGHYAGDLLLQRIGPRIQTVAPHAEIARLGGDEFGLILADADAAGDTAERVHDALLEPFELEDLSVSVHASIGIAVYPRDAQSTNELLQRADVAMYQAKETHARYAFYAAAADCNSRERLALVAELKGAIEREELVVHYQPQVDLRDGRTCGVEALVRWQHPERGLIGPQSFMAIAERTGVMRELTNAVLAQALEQHRAWLQEGHELTMAVNVSATNLVDAAFLPELREQLRRWRTPPGTLRLEITETVLISEGPRVRTVLDSLAALGVKLSLDDFGTGYSPLSYLRELPVNEIKIDRSFIEAMMTDAATATIVSSVITLAHRLGMDVVAEGIETTEQAELLRSFDCTLAQGYYFSRPLAAQDLARWLGLAGAQAPDAQRAQAEVLPAIPRHKPHRRARVPLA
jgi:diguanylate cyclase (GGDEF)-like protein